MNLDISKPILFIDTSYLIFYRYYAVITWYKASHKKETIESTRNWFLNKEYMEKFDKLFMKKIEGIIKKKKIPMNNVIFTIDCPRKEIWRMKLFDKYKANRDAIYNSDK